MATTRQLTPEDDLGELIALSRQFFAEYEAHHGELFRIDELRDSHITDYFLRTLGLDDSATFVAVHDGSIIGYITVYVRSQEDFFKIKTIGAVSGMMVHMDHRRKGIGTRLMTEARTFLQNKGVAYFTVYTACANEGALRFYERNGMTPLYATMVGQTDTPSEGR